MRLRPSFFIFAFLAAVAAFGASGSLRAQSIDPAGAAAGATNPPVPSPKPTAEDPRIHKLAVQQFLAWQTATVNRDVYSDSVNAELTDDLMDRATKTLANLGALQEATFQGISTAKSASLFVYKMTCQNGSVQMDFAVDPAGKISLIFFE